MTSSSWLAFVLVLGGSFVFGVVGEFDNGFAVRFESAFCCLFYLDLVVVVS